MFRQVGKECTKCVHVCISSVLRTWSKSATVLVADSDASVTAALKSVSILIRRSSELVVRGLLSHSTGHLVESLVHYDPLKGTILINEYVN